MPAWLTPALNPSLYAALLRLGLIWLIALIASRGLRLAARQVERRLGKTTADPERLGRLNTLVQAGRSVLSVLILLVAALMALQTVGVQIGPVLAAAGVAGLALSLGAQTLIKDFIGGILILLENQFKVGDVITVGEVDGVVERITLRATYLRNVEGRQHIIPNGEMRIISNQTKDWSRAVVEFNVPFDSDFERVRRALEASGQRVQADEALKAYLLEPPQALGWIGFKEWAAQVRVLVKTVPGKQWDVAMALRKHALEALRAEGVPVALPVQEVRLDKTT